MPLASCPQFSLRNLHPTHNSVSFLSRSYLFAHLHSCSSCSRFSFSIQRLLISQLVTLPCWPPRGYACQASLLMTWGTSLSLVWPGFLNVSQPVLALPTHCLHVQRTYILLVCLSVDWYVSLIRTPTSILSARSTPFNAVSQQPAPCACARKFRSS